MITSIAAPPKSKSSHDGFVSGRLFNPLAVDSLSSTLARSSPQPAQIVSRPVPPTIQSLPRSPKITSSPSVGTPAYDVPTTQRVSAGPSVSLKLSAHSKPVPLFDSVPVGVKRILRSGSFAS